jgi:hypothetical protein
MKPSLHETPRHHKQGRPPDDVFFVSEAPHGGMIRWWRSNITMWVLLGHLPLLYKFNVWRKQ